MHPYRIHKPQTTSPSAIVFDSPHSGIALPAHFRYACDRQDLMHLHDPHIEKLLAAVPRAGAVVLEALIHRTCIDLNRFDDEVNADIIVDGWPGTIRHTCHTAQNLGIFPVRAGPRHSRDKDIYSAKTPLTATEARHRIDAYHKPYYRTLHTLIDNAVTHNGHAIHVDVHSFYRRADHKNGMADIILGDMDGTTCDPAVTSLVHEFLKTNGYHVDFNGPFFSGGALIQSTANVPEGRHSIQIEIARDQYMDPDTLTYHPEKGGRLIKTLAGLATALQTRFTP